jgi:hypothetical protein
VNPGGEPERDDTGLPPVDIEIPDDARDLDRDVQAYRRELRALRRGERRGRWHRSLGRDGVVLPLLACCLILALITGTLLTVFTATSDQNLTRSGPSAPTRSAASGLKTVSDQQLPDATIAVPGAELPVQQLEMLVLVPASCDCTASFRWLAEVASEAGVLAYVIYTPGTKTEVERLYGQLDGGLHSKVTLAVEADKQDLLSPAKVPAGIPAGQLTAILVGSSSRVTWVSNISASDSRAPLVRALKAT